MPLQCCLERFVYGCFTLIFAKHDVNANKLLLIFVFSAYLMACGEPGQTTKDEESAISGTTSAFVDQEVLSLFEPGIEAFIKEHPKASVEVKPVTSREAVRLIIDKSARIAIVARDYMVDEDSVIREIYDNPNVAPARAHVATDALVLYASHQFPYDTLNLEQVRKWIEGEEWDHWTNLPLLKKKPTFVSPGAESSVAGYLMLRFKAASGKLQVFSIPSDKERDQYVRSHPDAIGLGFMSRIAKDSSVKMLRIGFSDSTGKRIRPAPVHPGYVIQDKYPFPAPIYVILSERASQHSLPAGLLVYLTRNGGVQKSFLDAGILPAHARIQLVPKNEQ